MSKRAAGTSGATLGMRNLTTVHSVTRRFAIGSMVSAAISHDGMAPTR
jgi:hypothetical protein